METIFLRCATDLLAGRREYESAPLRLLTDASFYEMEAIAETGTLGKGGEGVMQLCAEAYEMRRSTRDRPCFACMYTY